MLCDSEGCRRALHLDCTAKPRLTCVPVGEWFCPWCVLKHMDSGPMALHTHQAEARMGYREATGSAADADGGDGDSDTGLRRNSSLDIGCMVRVKPVDGWRRLPIAQVPQGRFTWTTWQQERVCMEESTGKLYAIGGGQVSSV